MIEAGFRERALAAIKNGIMLPREYNGMSSRELIALGTGSQVPTRVRSHNAYLLRWDGEGFLFDPGEGTQRQLAIAGIAPSSVHHICITHFHGDHSLGLAGIVQRLSLDRCESTVNLYYPESGQPYVERLCGASIFETQLKLIFHPIPSSTGMVELHRAGQYTLMAHALDHRVPTIGFRLEESPRRHFLIEELNRAGVSGPMVGELQREGSILAGGHLVRLEDVTVSRAGSIFAFVMDTRPCSGAVVLAKDADLFVMEATYISEHAELARQYFHSTAGDAARVAQRAGARQLAITHFSQRYPDAVQHLADAREIFPNVIALNDFDRIAISRRH
jgi:ribonuclease Z